MEDIRFIESLKVFGGEFANIELHQKRINLTSNMFSISRRLNLKDINIPKSNPNSIQKCRIIYSNNDSLISFSDYSRKKIESLRLVFDDSIDYGFKFENRERINELYNKREGCSDIIIVKRGLITDTSFTNLVFFDGKDYYTPSSFLLNGTMRQKLLIDKRIKEREIGYNDIKDFKTVFLINCLNSIEDNLSISIRNIL